MAKFHVNLETGNVGSCRAESGRCPFGGEENHFTSNGAARKAAEQILSEKYPSKTLGLKELNSLAAETNDHSVISEILERGSSRTLANLSKNKNLTEKELKDALSQTDSPQLRIAFMESFGSWEQMSPRDFEELTVASIKNKHTVDGYEKLTKNVLRNEFVSDADYDAVQNSDRISENEKKKLSRILLSGKNQISPEKVLSEIEKGDQDWRSASSALVAFGNGKLRASELKKLPKEYLDAMDSGFGGSSLSVGQLHILGEVALDKNATKLIQGIARDKKAYRILDNFAHKNLGKDVDALIFANSNLSESSRQVISRRHSSEPFVKVGNLRANQSKEEVDSILGSPTKKKLGRAYNEVKYSVNLEKAKKYGLGSEDILYLANASGYNAGVNYNPETGEFSGRVDSSD